MILKNNSIVLVASSQLITNTETTVLPFTPPAGTKFHNDYIHSPICLHFTWHIPQGQVCINQAIQFQMIKHNTIETMKRKKWLK
jgi:hypothetical protein